MEVGKNKLKSIIKQVQNSAEVLANKSNNRKSENRSSLLSSPLNPGPNGDSRNTKLDLMSAIEYNYCLINSYLHERNQRKLSPYEEILKTLDGEDGHDEDSIINSIGEEFFLDPLILEHHQNGLDKDHIDNSNCEDKIGEEDTNFDSNNSLHSLDGQSKILEMCVLSKLPKFNEAAPNLGDEFLSYIEVEKKKLNRQQTIVSKRLTEMILTNDKHFKTELDRIRLIEGDLSSAVEKCSNGRKALSLSKQNFTETSIGIIENYRRREAIVRIIECLQNIKKLRQTIERIEYMLQYDKNFSNAISLFDEKFEQLESMSTTYLCVAEMKEKLVTTLQMVDDQMDSVLSKMTDRFCLETFTQLCKAYSQIGKTQSSIHQLSLHFINAIHDKAFSIVLGYVKLFTPDYTDSLTSTTTTLTLGPANASSTPIKTSNHHHNRKKSNEPLNFNDTNLKRKPLAELCQYLNPESFLQCLTDLCRALWDIMNNYHQILSFYKKESKNQYLDDSSKQSECQQQQQTNLTADEIEFAVEKLSQGVLRIWSDIQHKIRTLVSSVQFVQQQDISLSHEIQNESCSDSIINHHQDQLLFSFEEFIKILTVCERMIEIGEQFCQLYHSQDLGESTMETITSPGSTTIEFQNTLYQQTRAYFQSYHQVSMSELKIFLENETWARCPIDTTDEFELIANLQEFSFMKNRLLKMKNNRKRNSSSWSPSKNSSSKPTSPIERSALNSSFLLSPVTKSRKYFNVSYFQSNAEDGEIKEKIDEILTPFDGIITHNMVSQQTFDDDLIYHGYEESDVEDHSETHNVEIVTTNTTLNVIRLMGRYMNIMFLLRPISHDIIKALLELLDYYFYTVYHFFAVDILATSWLLNGSIQSNSIHLPTEITSVAVNNQQVNNTGANQQQQSRLLLNHFSSFIRRINDTLILNDSSATIGSASQQQNKESSSTNSSPSKTSPSKHQTKYPCPTLPEYVSIGSSSNYYALGERIMAIQSLIFIARQFYHLCPFLLEFLRFEDQQNQSDSSGQQQHNIMNRKKSTEDGFKLLQFHYDKMCSSVESLQYQCLYAVSSKLLPYESIVQQMQQTKWDLKEIPSIHSPYVNVFVQELLQFDLAYQKLLESYDLSFLIPPSNDDKKNLKTSASLRITAEDMEMPLAKLYILSKRMNLILWECILKICNRTFVEGFASARKCTNEGRALMQLDYEQFLSHIEKLMMPYFRAADTNNFMLVPSSCTGANDHDDESIKATSSCSSPSNHIKTTLKSYLAQERLFVEEFVKAFYITEPVFLEWIRQKPNNGGSYTTKQIVSLINCITIDNKKLRNSLLAAIDTSSLDNYITANNQNNFSSTPSTTQQDNTNSVS